MNGSLFAELDRFCGQFALALHNAELQIYAVLTLLLVLGILLFPPKNDPEVHGTALVVASLLLGNLRCGAHIC